MNDITEKPVDRFHKPKDEAPEWTGGCGLLGEMTGNERRDFEAKTNTGFNIPSDTRMMEFAPEPLHMTEAKARSVKFTVGKRYPVLEKKESFTDENGERCNYKACYTFKTKDDNEKEVWIDEKYFIPACINLMHEKTCGWTSIHDDGLKVSDDGIEESVDIRKLATEKNVPDLDVSVHSVSEEDLQTLSGLKEGEYDGSPYYQHKPTGDSFRHSWNTCARRRKLFQASSDINEGVVKDEGNDLMNDATKCMAAIEKVFGNNKIADPDDIIGAISNYVPHLLLVWEDQVLSVNGAKTKITYDEVNKAYSGLKGLVSAKIAVKTIGKLVAGQIKKLF
jgi:hypothetical protein